MDPEEMKDHWHQQHQEAEEAIMHWRKAHPRATLAEIEAAVDQEMDRVRARMIEDVVHVQPAKEVEPPTQCCPQCGEHMQSRGTRQRKLKTRGGHDVALTRGIQSCPCCGYSFFPPR